MSFKLTKNCDVALLMSLVRAMESVPRVFFTPLSASFLMGGMVLLLRHVLGEAAALDDEAGNDAMKDGAVEEAFVDVLQEIGDRDRRLLLEELDGEIDPESFRSGS